MSISLAKNPCSVDNGNIVEYDVLKNKKVIAVLWYCSKSKSWNYSDAVDGGSATLVNIAEAWSLLVNRLGFEKDG